jgi:hypothetical protein
VLERPRSEIERAEPFVRRRNKVLPAGRQRLEDESDYREDIIAAAGRQDGGETFVLGRSPAFARSVAVEELMKLRRGRKRQCEHKAGEDRCENGGAREAAMAKGGEHGSDSCVLHRRERAQLGSFLARRRRPRAWRVF